MTTVVIADAHLGGPGKGAGPMVEQLRALPAQGCSRLVLLGDIFHVWIGSRKFETEEIRTLLPALQELRRQGIVLHYIEGNRDFFLDASPYADIFHSIGTELSFEVGGQRYLAVHGDGLNDRDVQYLLWRRISKSLPVRWVMLGLPGPLARYLVRRMEARLARTNFKHRLRIPEEAILEFGRARLREGFDRLLLGHFHEPRRWQVEEGEIHLVDAWFNRHHCEWLGARGGVT